MNPSDVTIVVCPRDHFSSTRDVLADLRAHTPEGVRVVVVDGGSPRSIARATASFCAEQGWTVVRTPHLLTGNDSKNLVLGLLDTPYTVFMDNDLHVLPGWLPPLIDCLESPGCWASMPLYLESARGRVRCHVAETWIWGEPGPDGRPEYRREMRLQNVAAEELDRHRLERSESDAFEYHLFAIRTDALRRIAPLDPGMLGPHDHIDTSLVIQALGGKILMDPASRVLYEKSARLGWGDLPFFLCRWTRTWIDPSLDRFRQKWGLSDSRKSRDWFYRFGKDSIAHLLPWYGWKGWLASRLCGLTERFVRKRYWDRWQAERAALLAAATPAGHDEEARRRQLADFAARKFVPRAVSAPPVP